MKTFKLYIVYVNVQAVLFGVNDWNTSDCRKWLYKHGYIPLKRVHKTSTFLLHRILQPNYNEYVYHIEIIQKSPTIKLSYILFPPPQCNTIKENEINI